MDKTDRITERIVERVHGQAVSDRIVWTAGFDMREVKARLAAYEDTGWSPEEITELQYNHERLHDFERAESEELRAKIRKLESENEELRMYQADIFAISLLLKKYE